jgi:hypothetical protein
MGKFQRPSNPEKLDTLVFHLVEIESRKGDKIRTSKYKFKMFCLFSWK